MKIETGKTLNQFVEYLYSEYKFISHPSLLNEHKAECFDITVNYMQFLSQPLKKEMFVNEIEKPKKYDKYLKYGSFGTLTKTELEACQKYKDAEKKVIFKGWSKSTYHKYRVISGLIEIDFSNSDFIAYSNNGVVKMMKTIRDLFQATNGELQLQNVEL